MDEWALTKEQAIRTAKHYQSKYYELLEAVENTAKAISILKRKSIPPVKRCKRALQALTGDE